ncbi:stAR-related lipid transfer protein 6 [Manis javanica]|uniref:stAR-related lipid transfer protein 6 n=1 Tax=Manis javanica TaxID=9974 RepID=UPI003C6D427B
MDYKTLAQQTAQEILGYNQNTSGWKVVKTLKKTTVSSKASKKFHGNLYRVEGISPESTSKLSEFLYNPENRWDKSLKVYSLVHRIDLDTFICQTDKQSFAMGSISPQEFINLAYFEHYEGNMDIISSSSVDFPPFSNYICGHNHACGYVCSPLQENPAHSKLVMLVQTIIEEIMPSNLVSFILNAKDGIKTHKAASGQGWHHKGH